MSSTDNTFQEVLSSFKKRLTAKELAAFQHTTFDEVRESVLRIQSEQVHFTTMMNIARLESFLEAMKQFSKIIEVFGNSSSFVGFVWGPMKLILETANTYTDSLEVLLDAYSQIGEHMPLLGQYESLFGKNPHMVRVLALMYADILEFHKRAIRFFETKVWRQLFRSLWKTFETRFKNILRNLTGHRRLVMEQAALVQQQQYQDDRQRVFLHIKQYELDREERHIQMKKQEEDEMNQKARELLAWLSLSQTTAEDHSIFRKTRNEYAGSGQWIMKDDKIQNWMEDTPVSSIVWMNAIPGAGKTILASIIIDACLQDRSFTTAYFYCKENNAETNSCIGLFRGLLTQFLNQCPELIPYCYDKYRTSGELNLSTTGLAEQLLKLFIESLPKLYIIIDGLDECDDAQRKLILSFFTKIVSHCDDNNPGKLRVLFTSQDYLDIAKALQAAPVLRLTAEDNKKDIAAYVRVWCKKIQEKHELSHAQVQDIEEATCIRAQGMFLFAKLVMENLYAQDSQRDVIEETQEYRFPNGLEEAYERIIHRIKRNLKQNQWKTACKLLGWVVCAKRPLKWREIQAAVSINLATESIEFEDRKLRSDIREYCGSLIGVLPGDRIELVHATAKTHIRSSKHIHVSTVECNLTVLCLRYLTFECFDSEIAPADLLRSALEGSFSFQDYAAAKWPDHIRAIIDMKPDILLAETESQALEELEVALVEFASYYEDEMRNASIDKMAEKACEPSAVSKIYSSLLHVWNHISQHHAQGPKFRDDISIQALRLSIFRNRKLIEELSAGEMPTSVEERERLALFYGKKVFKCPRITCFYFHDGFKTSADLAHHTNRHDRPFVCVFPDCSVAEFGFASNKDLLKHQRFFHPETVDEENAFSTAPRPTTVASKWRCETCGKLFTRGFHMRNHIRSHLGERPFSCSECGKSFTRANDCKRHEKIHTRLR